MKKLFLGLAVTGFLVASCTGDYKCDCVTSGQTWTAVTYTKVKKKDAQDDCSSRETTYQIADPSTTCSISDN